MSFASFASFASMETTQEPQPTDQAPSSANHAPPSPVHSEPSPSYTPYSPVLYAPDGKHQTLDYIYFSLQKDLENEKKNIKRKYDEMSSEDIDDMADEMAICMMRLVKKCSSYAETLVNVKKGLYFPGI